MEGKTYTTELECCTAEASRILKAVGRNIHTFTETFYYEINLTIPDAMPCSSLLHSSTPDIVHVWSCSSEVRALRGSFLRVVVLRSRKVKTYTTELECSASAPRMFKAACLDSHNLFPKILSHAIKSAEFVQGDCVAPGNFKLIVYVSEGEPKCVKHRVDEVDVEKLYYRYTTPEADILGSNLDCIMVEEKVEANSSGCVVRITGHFHTKGDAVLDKEKLKMWQENITSTFRAVDEYLQANPEVYA